MGVRARVSAVAALVVLIVLTIAAIALVTAQRAVLTDSVDETLQRTAEVITDAVDAGTLPPVLPGRGDEESFAIVQDSNGQVVAATAGAPAVDIAVPATGAATRSVVVPDGGNFRVRVERQGDMTVIVGTPLDDVDESVAALTRGLLIAVPTATALLALVIWILVGRVLRPVERIRTQVAEISSSSLDRRVPEPATNDEIARLARTMNSMLSRLEAAADSQRRFVSDASHELRSPLARIRTALEVDLAHPQSADLRATHRVALKDADLLQRLIDDLLVLARLDEASPVVRREPVDLDDVVLEEVRRLGPAASVVDVSRVSAAQVIGDRGALARVVRNLLDNALNHGGPPLRVELAEVGEHAVLSVSDDGPGIPPPMHDRIFERFARVDEARPSTTPGTGLGLAIARELVQAHGGTLAIDPSRSPGARFVAHLPVAGGQTGS